MSVKARFTYLKPYTHWMSVKARFTYLKPYTHCMSVKARFTYLKPYTHFPKRLSYVDINVPNQPLKYIRKQSVPCSRKNVFHATPLVFYQSIRGVLKVEKTGQNNAEGQVFRAKADQPAFVAWTAGVCCRMTRRINVPH